MTQLAPGAWYADHAVQRSVEISENVSLARDTYRVRFPCAEIAQRIVPGQFLMVRLTGGDDPLLGRPLALYDTVLDRAGQPVAIDIVYLVIGKMTRRLAELRPGCRLDVWGPLGNGFPPQPVDHLILVAGGIGQTPLLALAREHVGARRYGRPARDVSRAARVTLCYGTRTASLLAGVEDFRQLGVDIRLSTDDGTHGHAGLVTEVLEQVLRAATGPARIVCCGPEPMMKAVAGISRARGVDCQVSLETPMACGLGICFSCVARVRTSTGGWDYRRTCVEGPVFDAAAIAW